MVDKLVVEGGGKLDVRETNTKEKDMSLFGESR